MKHDWKKDEKSIYAPKTKAEAIWVPSYPFITIHGHGSPDTPEFKQCVQTLFSLAYTLKFSVRNGLRIEGYQDYAVYPLEGIWDIQEVARLKTTFTREDYMYHLMIRQPDFITEESIQWAIDKAKKKDSSLLWDQIRYERIEDGDCVQIMHIGPFAEEHRSFDLMKAYIAENGLRRRTLVHREIYCSDFTKTAPEKLKTILRIFVEKENQ